MDELTAEELLEQLRQLDENPRIEAKRGRDIGPSVMQSICAFANEPGLGGGYLLLGVQEPDETHSTFFISGVNDTDDLLNSLQANCRDQFETPIAVQGHATVLEGKKIIRIFVPELDPAAKPCVFKGLCGKKNKRKTGVWRRGLNSDYECSQTEIEPLLLAKSGTGFEQVLLDSQWDDLDPAAIALYRNLRTKVRPDAEELNASDPDMLRALHLVKHKDGHWVPNVAGLLLMGKPLALRRLLPAVRVDYIRIAGSQWVEDPEQRFATTLDLREPLLRLIPKLEAAIVDDLPRHFHLEEGSIQRTDQPLLPQKVVREAIVNAVMHRDYQVNQPIQVVRYSNRIEMKNAGYSLKPETLLGEMGSKLRNPILAAVLYDLNFAETKGSGIRTMRSMLKKVGLTAPVFASHIIANEFLATYLLHQLLGEEQLSWLKRFSHLHLADNDARALILAKETGAVDNAGLRAVTDLDTLSASQVLQRLHHQLGLLQKGGAGPATYYRLAGQACTEEETGLRSQRTDNTDDLPSNTDDLRSNTGDLRSNTGDLRPNTGDLHPNTGDFRSNTGDLRSNTGDLRSNTGDLRSNTGDLHPNTGDLHPNTGDLRSNTGDLRSNTGDLRSNTGDLRSNTGDLSVPSPSLPDALLERLRQLKPKARKEKLRPLIVWLCALQPCKADQLAQLLGGRQVASLKSNHINALRAKSKLLAYTHPEVVNHPEQAYTATAKGLRWLKEQGILVNKSAKPGSPPSRQENPP